MNNRNCKRKSTGWNLKLLKFKGVCPLKINQNCFKDMRPIPSLIKKVLAATVALFLCATTAVGVYKYQIKSSFLEGSDKGYNEGYQLGYEKAFGEAWYQSDMFWRNLLAETDHAEYDQKTGEWRLISLIRNKK